MRFVKDKSHQASRIGALAELSQETDDILAKQASGDIDPLEAERQLDELRERYETPFDRFLAAHFS